MKENDDELLSNDEKIERNSKFEKSPKFNEIIKSIEQYFNCSNCFKLIKNTIVCDNCLKLFCNSCAEYFISCPNCKICPFKLIEDKNIDYVIQKLFPNEKLLIENLNFPILMATDLNTLYKEKGIRNLIKEEEKDFDSLSSKSREIMINNLSNISFSSEFDSIDEAYTYTNLFEIIENNGKLMKKEIEETKKNEPEKYIEINDALSNSKNSDLFISGLLAKHLNNEGVDVAIIRQTSKSIKNSIMNLLTTGLYKGKIIQIHFDYGEKKNNQKLTNEKLKNKFIKLWLTRIHSKIKIKKNNLYFKSLFLEKLSLSLVSMENIEITKLEKLKNLFKEIKEIEYKLLLEGCVICPDMFDTRWNNRDGGWAKKGEKRGGREYIPPYGWIGYGLNVIDKYDNKNNTWLGMKNIKGEWWVAYHGNGIKKNTINDINNKNNDIIDNDNNDFIDNDNNDIINKDNNDINDIIDNDINDIIDNDINDIINNANTDIINNDNTDIINNFNHISKKTKNINELSKNKYPFVGIGLYLTDKIDDASFYSGVIEHLNHKYNITFMCRVCPQEVRFSKEKQNYFVVNPNENCVRPYRILLKEIKNKNKNKCYLF